MDRVERDALRAWTPVRINIGGSDPTIDWAMLHRPFLAPFFEQSAHEAMQHPFNAVFARRTPLAVLDALAADAPPVAPAGLIFHMSRCGSTLVAQMLSRISGTTVLSEPQSIDALLRLRPRLVDAVLIARLRALVAALGGRAADNRIVLKLHAWHALALPLFLAAFPDVPRAFVFREPRAVLRSQARQLGSELIPGVLDASYSGVEANATHAPDPFAHGARLIARFCEMALRTADYGRSAFLEYDALPDTVISRLMPLLGLRADRDDEARMVAVGIRDAKADVSAAPSANTAVTDALIERLASELLDAPYAAMRRIAVQ